MVYKIILVLVILATLVALGTLLFASSVEIKVVEFNVKSSGVSEKIRIALITDLHSCDYGENQIELLSQIYLQKPDIVLLGGDIVDDILPQDNAKEFLFAIAKKYLTFYVSGNHEFWSGEIDEIKEMIRGYGVFVLEGDCIPLEIRGQTINICGVDDPYVGKAKFEQQLKDCASSMDANNFSLLLTHRPELILDYARYNYDLILAGHAHGGQWIVPGVINGLYAPNQGIFPKYAGGLYKFENTSMVVSRGLAKESTRVPRIFNRPEVVIINIDKL